MKTLMYGDRDQAPGARPAVKSWLRNARAASGGGEATSGDRDGGGVAAPVEQYVITQVHYLGTLGLHGRVDGIGGGEVRSYRLRTGAFAPPDAERGPKARKAG